MIVGIVCEFDPLHNGHARLLAHARTLGADVVICAMSGNFTQRGDFAALSKTARAEMAVRCGADLVLELPAPWAMATAETFARGGVALLRTAGADSLLFGSECGDTAALARLAACLDSAAFAEGLASAPDSGATFAVRRQTVAAALTDPETAALLESPNNTLAVEYLRALSRLGGGMTPYTLRREGAAHDGAPAGDTASASYLRALLRQGRYQAACGYMPVPAAEVLRRELAAGRLADGRLCERAILARARGMSPGDWRACDPGGEGLCNRMYRAARTACTVEELLAAAKTKRYPLARLRRMLLASWLRLPPAPDTLPYLRVLAATAAGRAHLRGLRDAGAPVLTKPADAAALGAEAETLLALESRCTDLYVLGRADLSRAAPGQEYRTVPAMV